MANTKIQVLDGLGNNLFPRIRTVDIVDNDLVVHVFDENQKIRPQYIPGSVDDIARYIAVTNSAAPTAAPTGPDDHYIDSHASVKKLYGAVVSGAGYAWEARTAGTALNATTIYTSQTTTGVDEFRWDGTALVKIVAPTAIRSDVRSSAATGGADNNYVPTEAAVRAAIDTAVGGVNTGVLAVNGTAPITATGTTTRTIAINKATGVIASSGAVATTTSGWTVATSGDTYIVPTVNTLYRTANTITLQSIFASTAALPTANMIQGQRYYKLTSGFIFEAVNATTLTSYKTDPTKIYIDRATGTPYITGGAEGTSLVTRTIPWTTIANRPTAFVSKIVAGTGIALNPTGGTGNVTVTVSNVDSLGGWSSAFSQQLQSQFSTNINIWTSAVSDTDLLSNIYGVDCGSARTSLAASAKVGIVATMNNRGLSAYTSLASANFANREDGLFGNAVVPTMVAVAKTFSETSTILTNIRDDVEANASAIASRTVFTLVAGTNTTPVSQADGSWKINAVNSTYAAAAQSEATIGSNTAKFITPATLASARTVFGFTSKINTLTGMTAGQVYFVASSGTTAVNKFYYATAAAAGTQLNVHPVSSGLYYEGATGKLYRYSGTTLVEWKITNATNADQATSATSATHATSADQATSATSAGHATSATSADWATSASMASWATSASSASWATSASSASWATSASMATSAGAVTWANVSNRPTAFVSSIKPHDNGYIKFYTTTNGTTEGSTGALFASVGIVGSATSATSASWATSATSATNAAKATSVNAHTHTVANITNFGTGVTTYVKSVSAHDGLTSAIDLATVSAKVNSANATVDTITSALAVASGAGVVFLLDGASGYDDYTSMMNSVFAASAGKEFQARHAAPTFNTFLNAKSALVTQIESRKVFKIEAGTNTSPISSATGVWKISAANTSYAAMNAASVISNANANMVYNPSIWSSKTRNAMTTVGTTSVVIGTTAGATSTSLFIPTERAILAQCLFYSALPD